MKPQITEEQPINIYDLKKEISKIKKRDEELSLRSTKTEEYLNSFVVLKQKEAEDLENELTALEVPRLKDYHIKKIIDLLPASIDELKVVLQGYTLTINKEYQKKIIDTIVKYIPESK
jgi:DNA-directed RNA polymerase subunit F